MQENLTSVKDNHLATINIREEIEKYLFHWKWILLSILLCLFLAFLYMRYTVPQYKSTATILVKDERKGSLQSELSAFSDLGLTAGIKSNVDNEIEIIKSRTIIEKAIKKLGFNISYIANSKIKYIELYKDKPIDFVFYNVSDKFYEKDKKFNFKSINTEKFEIFTNSKSIGIHKYGEKIQLKDCNLVVYNISANKLSKEELDLTINVNKLKNVIFSYRAKLSIAPVNKTSSVVELSIIDPIKEKGEDFLNAVIEIYNQDAISDKKYISENTQNFIQDRLEIISVELGDVEKNAELFKKYNNVTDIVSEAGIYIQNASEFEKSLIETETQIRIIQSMDDFMKKKPTDELVPTNILPMDANSSLLITQHNELVLQKMRISKDGTTNNPVLKNIDQKIEETSGNIKESIARLKASLNIKKNDLQRQDNILKGKISQIPTQERQFRILDRQQKIKETLYLYLLQKREEIAISLAVTAPNSKLIDSAVSSSNPVSPVRNIVYLIALALGLLIPIGIIYLMQLMDTKIKTRQDIEGKISIPFLGDVPKSDSHEEIINTNSRSSSAEAIRIVRTNLEFMLSEVPMGKAKTIFVTSTLPKEGKTFMAINLASTIALSGKKVLLIGLDIRNPKIDDYIKIPSKGLTNYLTKNENNIEDYIIKLDGFENFYILPSGVIPPNPVDLLMNDKLTHLFEKLKLEYDYILVDTAPVSFVTDTLLVAHNADAFVYVMRANYLDKRFLKIINTFYTRKKITKHGTSP